MTDFFMTFARKRFFRNWGEGGTCLINPLPRSPCPVSYAYASVCLSVAALVNHQEEGAAHAAVRQELGVVLSQWSVCPAIYGHRRGTTRTPCQARRRNRTEATGDRPIRQRRASN